MKRLAVLCLCVSGCSLFKVNAAPMPDPVAPMPATPGLGVPDEVIYGVGGSLALLIGYIIKRKLSKGK